MSFDFRTLCGVEPDRPADRVAAVLMPLGVVASLLPWTPPWAALLAGAALALTLGNPCLNAANRAAKWLLQIAVVGLGAGVNLTVVARVGLSGLGYTLAGLVATFALGAWLARRLGIGAKVAALICAGTGICGGSAIAAAAPAIGAKTEETSAALAVVFLLNGVALLIFPAIGGWAGLDAHQFGLWCALAIHDTSSVTGAALTRGHESLLVATTVKLARALWIVPVALVLGAWFRRGSGAGPARRRVGVPWFIVGFVAISTLFTFVPELAPAVHPVSLVSRALLTLTLYLIGTGLSRAVVRAVGARPLLHALLLWIVIGGATLGAIRAGWVR
ncbi:MAG TPA: putative sulfate exporter family transporter [Lacunisphaera sp.]|nr:putative sulfate exporter family transporter [Lacunisphaera sp.]